MISSLSVLASLSFATLVCSFSTFIHIDAILSRHGVQGITGRANYFGRASVKFSPIFLILTLITDIIFDCRVPVGSQSVDAHLHRSAARIRRSLAFVYVHTFATGTGFEAARTICPSRTWRRRCRRCRRRHPRRRY